MVLKGYVRKSALPLAGLVAVGWLLLIIGFAMEVNEDTSTLAIPLRYSWWMVIVVTPIVLIMAVIYTLLDRFKEVTDILGAITTFLSALFLTALGHLLNIYGIILYTSGTTASSALQFGGALLAGLFWVALACLSHFYEYDH